MKRKRIVQTPSAQSERALVPAGSQDYTGLLSDIGCLLEQARRTAARSVNSVLTTTYWEIGRRIVEHEQRGKVRAEYGEALVRRLAEDLTARHGRGFSRANLQQMRLFYLGWEICQTPSGILEARAILHAASGDSPESIRRTPSAKSAVVHLGAFPLSWSHYVRLMSVDNPKGRAFYEAEAIRGGWSVRQLDRQVGTQFYERTAHSSDPERLLARAQRPQESDRLTAEEEVRDPYVLEFLNLKDEYSETELEDALIEHMEHFLLELGAGFTFVARQKRIRIGDSWYRIDLLLYHRGLRCLVVIDLKRGAFDHADIGQMALYLGYARRHMMMPGEAEPVGIILCSEKDDAVVRYATDLIRAKVFASKYLKDLPDEETLRREIVKAQHAIQARLKESKRDE